MLKLIKNEDLIRHSLNVLNYLFLTFVTIRIVGAVYIFAYNANNATQLLYIQTLFGNNPPLTFNSFLSSLVLAPIIETIILSIFFLKTLFHPKLNMLTFAAFFSIYHFVSMGIYGAMYTFFVGFIFAWQYYFNLQKYGKNTALSIALVTHVLLNLASFYA